VKTTGLERKSVHFFDKDSSDNMKSLENDMAEMLGAYIGTRQVGKKLSPELERKIKVANRQWGKAKDSILDVYRQALEDGWTPVEAAKICREKLVIFSLRTIRGILPDESKSQSMKRDTHVQKAQPRPQIAESLPQIVTKEDKQPDVNELQQELQQQPFLHPCAESGEEEESEAEEEPTKSPISAEQEQKHDDAVDEQYHHMRNLIEILSGIDYVKERDSNLALVDKTKDYRLKLVKQLSDLDVKTIYTDCRTLSLILNDYLKQLDTELDVRQAKEKLVSE
jgi:hypothetical protein